MRHKCTVATLTALVFMLVSLTPALAEVRAIRDQLGNYKGVQVLTAGEAGIWSPVTRGSNEDALNLRGDRRGDLLPRIVESSVDPGYPWAVWSRWDGKQFDLAWSRWSPEGWDSIGLIDPETKHGDSFDADLDFDLAGRPFVVWWRDQADVGRVYLSVFLDTSWMTPIGVSTEGVDSRYPTIEVNPGGQLIVRYETPEGPVEQLVWFDEPVTITDDINPLDVVSPEPPIYQQIHP